MSESAWLASYAIKLKFFSRLRRFLQKRASRNSQIGTRTEETAEEAKEIGGDDGCFALQRSVKKLHFGVWEEKAMAAQEIRGLAREDLKTRKSLAALGVIPALVSMLDSEFMSCRTSAVQALIQLANGTRTNKALLVEAGVLKTLSKLVGSLDPSGTQDFIALLLSLSSLADAEFRIPTSEFLPFLIGILNSEEETRETKSACLATLYNFSTLLDHAGALVSGGAVNTLVTLSLEKGTSERALATLGNLVVIAAGKQAVESDPSVPNAFIEILTWEDKPRCQELAAYILMILAHRSAAQREKMVQLGIVPVLLELALLGSPLAQRRALKILQRHMKMVGHSGPQTGRYLIDSPMSHQEAKEGKKAIKMMVKQSLDKNMESIVRRAYGSQHKLKSLVVSSSSKSLPY